MEVAAAVISVSDESHGRVVDNVNMQIAVPSEILYGQDRFGYDASFRNIHIIATDAPGVIFV